MTERNADNTSVEKNGSLRGRILKWFRSPSCMCFLMDLVTFFLILIIFFLVCVPKKYSLSVGSISHDTINATKDVVDEVGTEEKKNAAAAQVEPTYRFQQGVKEEVMNALGAAADDRFKTE